jgi:hypothetical protein
MKAWTYSHLDKYETCPKQFYHTSVAYDFRSQPTEATKWGEKVHTAFEHRIMNGTPLPEGMTQWEPIARKLEAMPGEKSVEGKIAITESFKPAPWNAAWSRGIADLRIKHGTSAVVVDYKTGKRKPSEQLELYTVYEFAHDPQLETVSTAYIWLKEKKIDKETYTRDDIPVIWQKLLPRVNKLKSAYERDSWAPKPSGLCKGWCPVTSCPHYKEKS